MGFDLTICQLLLAGREGGGGEIERQMQFYNVLARIHTILDSCVHTLWHRDFVHVHHIMFKHKSDQTDHSLTFLIANAE